MRDKARPSLLVRPAGDLATNIEEAAHCRSRCTSIQRSMAIQHCSDDVTGFCKLRLTPDRRHGVCHLLQCAVTVIGKRGRRRLARFDWLGLDSGRNWLSIWPSRPLTPQTIALTLRLVGRHCIRRRPGGKACTKALDSNGVVPLRRRRAGSSAYDSQLS